MKFLVYTDYTRTRFIRASSWVVMIKCHRGYTPNSWIFCMICCGGCGDARPRSLITIGMVSVYAAKGIIKVI